MGVNLYNYGEFIFFQCVLKLWIQRTASSLPKAKNKDFAHIVSFHLINHILINWKDLLKLKVPTCAPDSDQYPKECLNESGNAILLSVIKLLRLSILSSIWLGHACAAQPNCSGTYVNSYACTDLQDQSMNYIKHTETVQLGSKESYKQMENAQALLIVLHFLSDFQKYVKTLNAKDSQHYLYYCLSCWFFSSGTKKRKS